jgi:hypothetical protein
MANWERRDADALAVAINAHRKLNPGLVGINDRLAVVQVVVASAARTTSTTAGVLSDHRAKVCEICRRAKLYVCTVPVGWSDNCTFVSANASE